MSGIQRAGATLAASLLFLLPAAVLAAGNLTVVVKGGKLLVTGDAEANQFTVLSEPGFDPDQYKIVPADMTINGVAGAAEFTGIRKGMIFVLGAGGDNVDVVLDEFEGNVVLDAGDGDDELQIGGSMLGDVRVLLGDGANGFDLLDAATIDGKLSVRGGTGEPGVTAPDARISLYFNPNSTVHGKIVVMGGDAGDGIFVNDANLLGKATFKLGDGANNVFVSPGSVIGSNILVKGGLDDDFFSGDAAEFGGKLKLLSGDGTNSIYATNSHVAGNVVIKTGDGDDTADLSGTVIDGKTAVKLGGGSNTGP